MRIKKFQIFEGRGSVSRILDFQSFSAINESEDQNAEVVKKIRKAILWIAINKGFYGELLAHLNIYGSSEIDPPTMCTNGRDIIFHPDFVLKQKDEAVRFVLIHEILHCIGDHMGRRGTRNPDGWNIACDYAINPIIKDETGVEWPQEGGERFGLYEARFEGMRAEDIYDILEKSGELAKLIADPKIMQQADIGKIIDEDETPEMDSDLNIQDGDFPVDQDESGDEPGEPGEQPGDEPGDEPGEQPGDEPGDEPGEQPGEQPGDQPGDQPGEQPGDQPGDKPGDKPGDQPGDQPGESGESGDQPGEPGQQGEGGGEEGDQSSNMKVGNKVILDNGKVAIIKKIYPNGDIEV